MSNPRPTLDLLAASPAAADSCDHDTVVALLAQVAAVQSTLTSRLLALPSPPPEPPQTNGSSAASGELLSVAQASELIKKSPKWFSRNRRRLPFLRQVGRNLLINKAAFESWLEKRKVQPS